MTDSGLSTARLARVHDVMARLVEQGAVPGLVTVVSRRGEVHVDAVGRRRFSWRSARCCSIWVDMASSAYCPGHRCEP